MLKDVQHLLSPDPYYAGTAGFIGCSIEKLHQDMTRLELPSFVPERIRRCHDAVRHTYIYSYFSYDLVTVAVSQMLPCLEFALRERIGYQWKGKTTKMVSPCGQRSIPCLWQLRAKGLFRISLRDWLIYATIFYMEATISGTRRCFFPYLN
jgi:hypothetical protein